MREKIAKDFNTVFEMEDGEIVVQCTACLDIVQIHVSEEQVECPACELWINVQEAPVVPLEDYNG